LAGKIISVRHRHADSVLLGRYAVTTLASEGMTMQTAKQEVEALLKQLPDDSTHEDIQYHLYVLEKIRKGQDDINQGRTSGHAEAKERLKKWLGH
jgi:cell division protein FtsX